MYKQIAENKRRTVFIIMGFVLMIGVIAALFAWCYRDPWIAVWTVVAALIYALIQYYCAGNIAMAMTGAKEITKKENPRLYNIVENLSITTGLPMPKVYVIDDKAPNAFATGRDPKHAAVAATTGLMDIMNDKELTAVMAHEMSHVKNYDIRVSMIVFGVVCVIGAQRRQTQGAHEDRRWVKSSCRCREAPRPEDNPMQTDGKTWRSTNTGVNVLSSDCFKE